MSTAIKHAPLKTMLTLIDKQAPLPFALAHGDQHASVILYQPRQPDQQTPHDQDEYYFVASGSANLKSEGETFSLKTGDAILVPAQRAHSFESISDDFSCWAIFYGPKRAADHA